jgi:hypothetical protein
MTLFGEARETRLLGLVRVAFGAMLLARVADLAFAYRRLGAFADRFHMPLVPEAWVPGPTAYVALLAVMGALGVGVVLGVRARLCLLLLAGAGLYLMACDRLQYHNNRFALFLLAFLLAFAPCDRSFALRPGGPPGPAPYWAVHLMQAQVSLVYLGSSLGKLLDPDWFGGQVLWVRAARSLEYMGRIGVEVPGFVADAMASHAVLSVVSKLVIATELFVALGLWVPRFRVLALWLGVMFHLSIELGARVELFSYLMWTSFVLFVTPEVRERRLLVADDARWLARAVRALDWLARFTVEVVPRAEIGAAMGVIDRDGTRATGMRGLAALARAVPLLFPLWLPLVVATRRRAPAVAPA